MTSMFDTLKCSDSHALSREQLHWRTQVAKHLCCRHAAIATAADGRVSKAAFMRSAPAELSCQLCRGNGRMLYASTFVIVRARGRTFTPGSPVPVAGAGYV
jgi:hypothetical protein